MMLSKEDMVYYMCECWKCKLRKLDSKLLLNFPLMYLPEPIWDKLNILFAKIVYKVCYHSGDFMFIGWKIGGKST